MALMFAYIEFADVNAKEGHVSYLARQLNRYIHEGFEWPECDRRILAHGFKYSWWHKDFGTTLNVGLEMNPEALSDELARLKEMFPLAMRAQIFEPEFGIPDNAEVTRPRQAKVLPFDLYRRAA